LTNELGFLSMKARRKVFTQMSIGENYDRSNFMIINFFNGSRPSEKI
jgi:hypothetical protein